MNYAFTKHVMDTIKTKNFKVEDVQEVLRNYDIRYPSNSHPGQEKFIGRGLCVVVDMERKRVVTVFKHFEITDLREDQKANGVKIR